MAGMARQGGYSTGYTTTEGIYLNKQLLYKGDCSGPQSAKVILQDPAVEFAVLETARGGILRNGLAFDKCSCAIITNVAEDHLGLDGIDTIEKLARVKSVVAESVMKDGFAVLNADDDIVYGFKDQLDCNIALFSLHANNNRIQRHCEAGGIAAVYEDGYILIQKGNNIIPVEEVANIPITFQGKARFNIANALAASLAAYLSRISLPAIRCTLRNFQNTADQAPGRMNLFAFHDFTVMLDYAHNPHGMAALGDFLKNLQASKLVGVIAGIGDRRSEDIVACGEQAARIFDEIIIRMDDDLRGRTEFEISSLLRQGIHNIAPEKPIHYFSNQPEAIEFAVNHAVPGSMVVVLIDNITEAIQKVTELQEKQKHSLNKNFRLAG
jgi:cyanophycin synthetase